MQNEAMPIIGIVPTQLPEEDVLRLNEQYIKAVVAAGGAPLVLPLTDDTEVFESIFPLINGFILTGGHDIDPARYGGPSTYDKLSELTPDREEVECLVLNYAYRFDIPTLGICRGMQVMNVFFGGTLYLDLADQFEGTGQGVSFSHERGIGLSGEELQSGQPALGDAAQAAGICPAVQHWQKDHYERPTHFVSIKEGSQLGSILGCGELATNSMHHQGVRDVAPSMEAVAFGPDGLVEGIEMPERTFMMGVQWHPEYFAGPKSMGCLFGRLIDEAALASFREERLRQQGFHIDRRDDGGRWPVIGFAEGI